MPHVVGMQLVEVIRTDKTDPAVFDLTKKWSDSLGQISVACGDTPGFIVNRLLVPALAQVLPETPPSRS